MPQPGVARTLLFARGSLLDLTANAREARIVQKPRGVVKMAEISDRQKVLIGFAGGATPYLFKFATFCMTNLSNATIPDVFTALGRVTGVSIFAGIGALLSLIWERARLTAALPDRNGGTSDIVLHVHERSAGLWDRNDGPFSEDAIHTGDKISLPARPDRRALVHGVVDAEWPVGPVVRTSWR